MKNKEAKILSFLLSLAMLFACALLISCQDEDYGPVWDDAIHKENTELGEGETSFTLTVKAGEKEVTITVKTDEKIVGEALQKLGLIEGEEGQFGIYIKKVNGILADYDVDGTYWAFYKDGKYMMTGVDVTELEAGASYSLVKEKG